MEIVWGIACGIFIAALFAFYFHKKEGVLERVKGRLSEYCYHELKKIDVMRNGAGVFNQRCHENAVQYAIKNKGYKVVMGFYRHENSRHYLLHFWVRKAGVDYEVSVGYLCDKYSYYEVKELEIGDYPIVLQIFTEALEYYKDKFATSTFERFLIRNEERIA